MWNKVQSEDPEIHVKNYQLPLWTGAQYLCTSGIYSKTVWRQILYIKMNICLSVCLYLIQIHISEPTGTKLCTHLPRGLEETVGYAWAHNISYFPPFRPILSGAGADSCTVDDCQRHTTPLLHYIRGAACAGVTSRTVVCAMKTRRSERNVCVWKWKPDGTGRKWLMNCTCNYIAFIQMKTWKLSNLRPSFFRSLSIDNTCFHLLNLSRRSSEMFR
jgi:hypothetical protein